MAKESMESFVSRVKDITGMVLGDIRMYTGGSRNYHIVVEGDKWIVVALDWWVDAEDTLRVAEDRKVHLG